MAWSSGFLGITAAVLCLCIAPGGVVQLDDCQDGKIYITNDTEDPSPIKCSGVAKDGSVTWFLGQNLQVRIVAQCPDATCAPTIPGVVEAQRFVNSGYSTLSIKSNLVNWDDATVRCQTSTDNAFCNIRIIDKLPSVSITGASYPLYAGEQADLKCVVSATESLPSLPVTYTWQSGAASCDVPISYVCRFYLEPQQNKEGVTCTLSYRDYSNIPGKSTTVTLNVFYPPPQAPVITGNREVSVGESLTLECRVYSGNPLVTAVIFSRGNHVDVVDIRVTSSTDDTSYVSSSVTIQSVQASDNGDRCECHATWEKPELYANRSSVTLTVSGAGTALNPYVTSAGTDTPSPSVPTNADELSGDPTNVNAGAIAGGVVAAVVVIAVVVVVLVFIIKRRNSRPKPRSTSRRDPQYDTEEHINPVYGTDDPSTSSPNNDIYGGGAADNTIPDIAYSAVGNGAQVQIPLDTQYAVVDKSRKNQSPAGTKQPQEEYAVVDKSRKNQSPAGTTQALDEYAVVDKSRKNQPPAPTHDEYAVVDKSRKNQPPATSKDEYAVVDKSRKMQPPATSQDEYAVVDKSRKKPAAKPKAGAKP